MKPINQLAEKKEQESAVVFSQCMNQVRELENQLEKLYSYRAGYHQQMTEISSRGLGSNRLQDTLMFMNNLNKSIEGLLFQIDKQKEICDAKKRLWMAQHNKTKIYTNVTEKYIVQEQFAQNKNEQKLLDEFNQSLFHRKLKSDKNSNS